jgi:hypothetical protein
VRVGGWRLRVWDLNQGCIVGWECFALIWLMEFRQSWYRNKSEQSVYLLHVS